MQTASTQTNIPIAGIKDGVTILKNGQYRLVLEVAAINFELKSEQEQNSLVFQYQSFLNSLHFPIEIVIRSNKLDLSPYLKKIKGLSKKQSNELIRIQTEDYADFVEQLISLANIMKKRFYVAVGYQPIIANNGLFDKIFHKSDAASGKIRLSDEDFGQYSKELRGRAQTIAQGLGSMGLHCRQLNTEEIINLFYEIYNPEVAGKERLSNSQELSSSYVTQLNPEAPPDNPQDINPAVEAEEVIDNTELVNLHQKQQMQEAAVANADLKTPVSTRQDTAQDTASSKS